MVFDARQAIEKLEQIVKKVTSPANRIGTFLGGSGAGDCPDRRGGADTTATSIRGWISVRYAEEPACW